MTIPRTSRAMDALTWGRWTDRNRVALDDKHALPEAPPAPSTRVPSAGVSRATISLSTRAHFPETPPEKNSQKISRVVALPDFAFSEILHAFGSAIGAQMCEPRYDDVIVCAGFDAAAKLWTNGYSRVVVIDRGAVDERKYSLSLNRMGSAPDAAGQRFDVPLHDWRVGDEVALIIGQPRRKFASVGFDFESWVIRARNEMRARGYRVAFRPHPADVDFRPADCIRSVDDSALKTAAVCVTYSSNYGVRSLLAGVPVIACHAGSLSLPVASWGLDSDLQKPDRAAWLAHLTWCEWTVEELLDGTAWRHWVGSGWLQ